MEQIFLVNLMCDVRRQYGSPDVLIFPNYHYSLIPIDARVRRLGCVSTSSQTWPES